MPDGPVLNSTLFQLGPISEEYCEVGITSICWNGPETDEDEVMLTGTELTVIDGIVVVDVTVVADVVVDVEVVAAVVVAVLEVVATVEVIEVVAAVDVVILGGCAPNATEGITPFGGYSRKRSQ